MNKKNLVLLVSSKRVISLRETFRRGSSACPTALAVLLFFAVQFLFMLSQAYADNLAQLRQHHLQDLAAQQGSVRVLVHMSMSDLSGLTASANRFSGVAENQDQKALAEAADAALTSAITRTAGSVLAGLSGVGKSSLLTAVQPNLKLRVQTTGKRGKNQNKAQGRFSIQTPGKLSYYFCGTKTDGLACHVLCASLTFGG